MAMLELMFNEAAAQQALTLVNKKIARLFLTEPKAVRFIFVDHIAGKGPFEILGQCTHGINEIKIKVIPDWQNTAVHELAHLYRPGVSEKETRKTTDDIINCLIARKEANGTKGG